MYENNYQYCLVRSVKPWPLDKIWLGQEQATIETPLVRPVLARPVVSELRSVSESPGDVLMVVLLYNQVPVAVEEKVNHESMYYTFHCFSK